MQRELITIGQWVCSGTAITRIGWGQRKNSSYRNNYILLDNTMTLFCIFFIDLHYPTHIHINMNVDIFKNYFMVEIKKFCLRLHYFQKKYDGFVCFLFTNLSVNIGRQFLEVHRAF